MPSKSRTVKMNGEFMGLTQNSNLPGLNHTQWRKSENPVHLSTAEYNRVISLIGKLADKLYGTTIVVEIAGSDNPPDETVWSKP